ncbi:MAG: pyruvate kinase [Candidatus Rifleibacteriota bacterium]
MSLINQTTKVRIFMVNNQQKFMRPSQIVTTLGPASLKGDIPGKMAKYSTGIRINVAHLDEARLTEWLNLLDRLRRSSGREFRIILDLQGAKVRIGQFPEVDCLDDNLTIFLGESSKNPGRIPVPNEKVFRQSQVGDCLFLNDRRVILEVVKQAPDHLEVKVRQNGALSSFKGINSPDRVFEMARVMPGDAAAIKAAGVFDNVSFAVSFVSDGKEAGLFKPLTGNCPLIAKIEQVAAFEHLPEIAAEFDELWLCRGDLGAEAGLASLGMLQRRFINSIAGLSRPCLLAGEVLGSMTVLGQPSRAEVVQLSDALSDGFCGFVLSDETAIGKRVAEVFRFLETFFS